MHISYPLTHFIIDMPSVEMFRKVKNIVDLSIMLSLLRQTGVSLITMFTSF